MAAINAVTLIGRVVRDIEVKTTNSGKPVASFALAVDGYGKDADASFIDCIAWNKAAEVLAEYAPKGKQIGITGRLQTRTWEKNGVKHKSAEVVIDQFQFLSDTKAANVTTSQAAKPLEGVGLGAPVDLSEIPF
jgi:single-strand DNA-binding protein